MKKEQVKNKAVFNVTFNYNVVPENPVHSVIVLGDFNEWSLENGYVLKPNKKGDFEGKFPIPAGRDYHFRYLVNGERWANEKHADGWEASPLHPHIDNSVLKLPMVEVTETPKAKKIVKKEVDEKEKPAKKTTNKTKEAPAVKKQPVAKKAVAKKRTADQTASKSVVKKVSDTSKTKKSSSGK
jgi:hypothetical protein